MLLRVACALAVASWAGGAGAAAPTVPCQKITLHEQCVDQGCEYNAQLQACHAKGLTELPCAHIFFEEGCRSSAHCTWHAPGSQCHAKGGSPPCDVWHEEKACGVKGCTWDSTRLVCSTKGEKPSCSALMLEDSCGAQDGCKWLGPAGTCIPSNEDDCSYLYSAPECEQVPSCRFHVSVAKCRHKDDKVYCEEAWDESVCKTLSQCEWLEAGVCHKPGLPLLCSRLYEETACKTAPHCEYFEPAHICKEVGTPISCDLLVDAEHCIKTGCQWAKMGNFCYKGDKLPCRRCFSQEDCEAAPHCTFRLHSCHDTAELEECNAIHTSIECMHYGCMWEDDKCIKASEVTYDHGEPPDPSDFDPAGEYPPGVEEPAQVEHGAVFDRERECENAQCREIRACPPGEKLALPNFECCERCSRPREQCLAFAEVEHCPATCEWSNLEYLCTEVGGVPPCDRVYDPTRCEALGCTFHEQYSVCTEPGQPVPCVMILEAANCSALPTCRWHQADMCVSSAPDFQMECSMLHEERQCELEPHCAYNEHAKSCHEKGVELECTFFYGAAGCKAQGERCIWLEAADRCLPGGEDPPCDLFRESTCDGVDHCDFDSVLQRCVQKYDFVPLPCHEFYDKRACLADSSKSNCLWNDHAFLCHPTDEKLECDRFFDEGYCGGIEGCTWNTDIERCINGSYTPGCADFYNETRCQEQPKCMWHPSGFMCLEEGAQPTCHSTFMQDTCESIEGCEWSAESGVCWSPNVLVECGALATMQLCDKFPDDCIYEMGAQVCRAKSDPVDCQLYHSDTCRNAGGGGVCKWVEVAQTCIGVEEEPFCMQLYSYEGCIHFKYCAWDARGSRCRELIKHREL